VETNPPREGRLPLPEQVAGKRKMQGEVLKQNTTRKFVFYRHFCHHSHNPFPQRNVWVKEEVTVAALLSPQPTRGRLAPEKIAGLVFRDMFSRRLHDTCNAIRCGREQKK